MIKRTKQLIVIYFAVLLLAGGLGVYFRGSYTDMQAIENYKEDTIVAAVPDHMLDLWSQQPLNLADNPDSIIFAAEPLETRQFEFYFGYQKIKIIKVFQKGKSNNIEEGMICYVSKGSDAIISFMDRIGINGGFVNEMSLGKQYLLLMQEEAVMMNADRLPVYLTETIIYPMFCYEDSETHVINPYIFDEEGGTYVNYKGLENNEFFTSSEEGYQRLMDVKHTLIERFPLE